MRAFAASGTRRTESPSQKSEEDAESEEDVDRSDSESSDCEVTTAKRAVSTGSFQSHASEKGNSNNPEDSVDDSLEQQSLADSDDPAAEYVDDETRKAREDAKVARLITEAEERATRPSQDNMKRAQQLLAGQKNKDSSTTTLMQQIDTTTETIADQLSKLHQALEIPPLQSFSAESIPAEENVAAEERLSLSVSKDDFKKMNIIGQFNLGFIIADRPGHMRGDGVISPFSSTDELFIIDQHASDEKYNFERLQATTIVQNQRLVQPKMLELTAIEEEIILENQNALLMNGFVIEVDESGDLPVGQRCQLISLPMSKEVTFSPRDLEELIVLLSEALPSSMDTGSDSSKFHNNVPRPSKVRKMFAMRACRSSVMIGKTLTKGQMQKLVQNMGEINQPWNCPHGRPTMRHLLSLGSWEGWQEGEGVVGLEEGGATTGEVAWNDWLDGLAESELEADSGSLEGDIEREDSEEGYSGLAGEVQERMVTDE
jgi:DNA mismatch repair protein PMS2